MGIMPTAQLETNADRTQLRLITGLNRKHEAAGMRLPHVPQGQPMVGMTKSAPSLMPEGQREVTVLVLV